MHRAMEFIIQQQAQYAARIDRDEAQYAARFERDESRLARLEKSFKMLVELVRRTNERPDTMATLRHNMSELAQSMITLAEAQSRRESC